MKISERGSCDAAYGLNREPNVLISKFKNSLAASIMSLAYFNVFKNTLAEPAQYLRPVLDELSDQ